MSNAAWATVAPRGSSRLWGAALGLVALVGAGLRLVQSGESLWLDELHTAWCALASLDEVGARAADGNQGPLFFWLQWALVRLLGASELSLRLTSILAGTALLMLVGVWVAQQTSPLAGLVAATLLAVDPWAIFWGSEARPYALVQWLGTAHLLAVRPLLTRPTRGWRLFWVLGGAALFHLHYTAVLLFAAELVIAGVWWTLWPQRVVYRPSEAARDVLVLLVLMWPAAGTLATISQRRTNWALFVDAQPLDQLFAWWPLALLDWRRHNIPRPPAGGGADGRLLAAGADESGLVDHPDRPGPAVLPAVSGRMPPGGGDLGSLDDRPGAGPLGTGGRGGHATRRSDLCVERRWGVATHGPANRPPP
jgi:hypothetical protein